MPSVLITGCAKGIGRAVALAFARSGFTVGINYKTSQAQAESLAQEIQNLGADSFLLPADICQPSAVESMLQTFVQRSGRLDILINNAGIAKDRSILRMSDAEWLESIDTHLNGTFWCLRAAAKIMKAQKEGSIVNISSYKALQPSYGHANYVASKAAVLGLTKAAAVELGRFNIRVNAVLPGFHVTDFSRAVWEKSADAILAQHTLGRLGDLDQSADFIVYLAQQKFVNGQVFNYDSRIL